MRFWILALTLSLLATWSQAAELPRVKVASMEWAGYSQADGSGYYIELLQTVFPADQYQLDFQFLPFARSLQFTASGRASIALGLYFDNHRKVLFSRYPVAIDVVDAAMTPELRQQWSGLESLSDKKVGAYIGYGLKSRLPPDANFQKFTSLKSMLKMLAQERLDVVLDYERDMSPIIDKIGANVFILKKVISIPLYFGFTPDSKGRQLKRKFDEDFSELLDQGKIKELIDKNISNAEPYYPFQCGSGVCLPIENSEGSLH